ncbi:MAG: hypothetical protein JSS41_06845 [Proteobacteria bacterium]|nr:hypothetical protein [Pseudomonadota bacterium]
MNVRIMTCAVAVATGLASVASLLAAPSETTTAPPLDPTLAHEIAAVRGEAGAIGDTLWPGYGKAPFGMLVVAGGHDTLICHGSPVNGFAPAGRDPTVDCQAQTRPASFAPSMLAAMPAIDGVSTIVMGTPEATGRSLPAWTRTIFHEHFHQYQSTFPDYYGRVAQLDLAGGDNTGMWMLNYPFPYADAKVGDLLAEAGRRLAAALAATPEAMKARYADYIDARHRLAASTSTRDWRYFDYELWYEGVARWTEIAIGQRSGDPSVRAAAQSLREDTLADLGKLDLKADGRVVVYSYGGAEAMLLDRCMPGWRTAYPNVLALGALFEQVPRGACR